MNTPTEAPSPLPFLKKMTSPSNSAPILAKIVHWKEELRLADSMTTSNPTRLVGRTDWR